MVRSLPLSDWRRRRPWLTGALVAVAGVAAMAAVLRFWITTDSGRAFITSQVNGLDIAGYGELTLEDLDGDPLTSMSIARLSIEGEDGVWIEARDVQLTWSPLALLSRSVQISEISARNVHVIDRPVREPRTTSTDESGSWQIQMTSLTLDELVLAEGVAGPRSTSEISARFVQQRNGSLDAALRLRPIEGRGDRVDLLVVMTASRRFDVTVIADAPAGGFFSHMLNLPPESAARLEASGGGDFRNGVAEARFSIDREDKIYLSGKIEDSQLVAAARINAPALPLPQPIADFLGPAAEASLAANLDDDTSAFEFDSLVAQGEIRLAGIADLARRELVGPARLRVDLASLDPFWEDGAGVRLDGELSYTSDATAYTGEMRLIPAETSPLPFEAAAGPVTVSLQDGAVPFTGQLEVFGPFALGDQVGTAIGANPRLNLNGRYEINAAELFLEAAQLEHDTGSLNLNGRVSVADQTLSLSGRVRQAVDAFVPGFTGTAEGLVSIEGPFDTLAASVALTLREFAGPDALAPLIAGSGQLAGTIRIAGSDVTTRGLRLRLPGAEATVVGSLAGRDGLALDLTAEQLADLDFSGAQVSLGTINGRLTRPSETLLINATSEGGRLRYGEYALDALAVTAQLEQSGQDVSGPVRVSGLYEDERATLSALFDRTDGVTQLNDISGTAAGLTLGGDAEIRDSGALAAEVSATGENFTFGGASIAQMTLTTDITQQPGEALSVRLDADLRDTLIGTDTRFERISGSVRTLDDSYSFAVRIEDGGRDPFADLRLSGVARLAGDVPEGTLQIGGQLFGQTIETRRDTTWRLGDVPEFNADLAVLGGGLTARLGFAERAPELTFALDDVDAGPILSLFRVPVSTARINGTGSFTPFGLTPSGQFEITTSSPVSGLDGAIDLDVTGRLNASALTLDGSANYGPALGGDFLIALPVTPAAGEMVALNADGALTGNGGVRGDLEAIRLIALAYGHDIGGRIDSSFTLGGTPETPVIQADASVSDGLYEYGGMGLRLNQISLNAALDDGALSVEATGASAGGGTVTATGRMGAEAADRIDLQLSRLLVYDRNGDRARLSGGAELRDTEDARMVTGALTIDEAVFSLDNLPEQSVRTLDVRWKEDLTDEEIEPVLEKPIRFDFSVASDRRIFINGRGLDSEWGVQLAVTGSPSAPLLNGRATLVRGELELARRPFVFDSGLVTFDGPLDTARIAIAANRQVNGFNARVDVTGSPTSPRIELSSTPDLPQDEILARMLFGRSVVDLSALEAAELASSIARLSGQRPLIDPLGGLQAGLGLDRLRVGMDQEGQAEIGVGQYLAPDVYLEVTTAGAAGNSVEVEWQPRPQVSVTSEARSTGETRVSIRWKRDY